MNEYIVNLHMHTPYSDGNGSHEEIANAALEAGIDVVIVTDHNVWVNGIQGYYRKGEKKVLLLLGEEVHDQGREPQKNHLLVIGAEQEMATLAHDPQLLIDSVNEAGGLAFLAHPIDIASPKFANVDLSWVNWEVTGYHGIELWNAMTEFKSLLKNHLGALFYAYNPTFVARGPFSDSLKLWDKLLAKGKRVVAIGGSDAHAFPAKMGPFRRIVFPYEFHFKAINSHILTPAPLTGDVLEDRWIVLEALRKGHVFIGNDNPHPTRGFRFSAQCKNGTAWMGDQFSVQEGGTLQIKLPIAGEANLLKDGKIIKTMSKRETMFFNVDAPGVYRTEAFINYRGKKRTWIISNPIYAKP